MNDNFIKASQLLEKEGHLDISLDVLYWRMHLLEQNEKYQEIDEILKKYSPESLTINGMLGLLTTTLMIHYILKERKNFFISCKKELEKRQVPDIDKLLRGLDKPYGVFFQE